MEIITGFTGAKHVRSEQDRDINIGTFGEESYVLQTGMKMAAEVSSNNEIKIRDGVIMHQGCAASIKKNTYDSVTIVNGSQGMKRIDLIVARYQRNQDDGKEFMRFVAIQGTPAESNPAVPSHITGDIQSGDAVADMPMYKIIIDGLNITEVQKVYSEAPNITELNRKLPFCGRGKGTVTSNEANSLNIPVTFPTAMNNTDYVVCANLVTGSIGAFDKNYDVEVIVTKKSLTGCTLSIMRGTFGFLDYGAVLSVEYIVLPS
nr:MAG TPA: hypothetical protein [Caudoviricetes sp.]